MGPEPQTVVTLMSWTSLFCIVWCPTHGVQSTPSRVNRFTFRCWAGAGGEVPFGSQHIPSTDHRSALFDHPLFIGPKACQTPVRRLDWANYYYAERMRTSRKASSTMSNSFAVCPSVIIVPSYRNFTLLKPTPCRSQKASINLARAMCLGHWLKKSWLPSRSSVIILRFNGRDGALWGRVRYIMHRKSATEVATPRP